MPASSSIRSPHAPGTSLIELREKIHRDKSARRRFLTKTSIPEKLRILEEMRDTTRALKQVREQNKAKVHRIVTTRAAKSA